MNGQPDPMPIGIMGHVQTITVFKLIKMNAKWYFWMVITLGGEMEHGSFFILRCQPLKSAFLVGFLLLYSVGVFSQTGPNDRLTNWLVAGNTPDLMLPSNIVHFSMGVSGNTGDNSPLLQQLLNQTTAPAIIQIPQGTFRFESQVLVPQGLILRGMGAGITILNFEMGGANTPCIRIQGNEIATEHLVSQDLEVGAQQVHFATTVPAGITTGDYIRFIQDDATLLNDSWAHRRTGQISKVTGVSGATLDLYSPMRMPHTTANNARVRKVNPVRNVGLACFTLNRVDVAADPRAGVSNIHISYAADCWIKGVESHRCNYAHVEILYSSNLHISDSYFHDAFSFGTGGRAYGVMMHFATSECRVENNVFRRLRHAMILQAGANGNVFAYNHSAETLNQLLTTSSDMVCHGNYAYRNLFEGNVGSGGTVDNSHGGNGPFNTFFRNRTTGFATFIGTLGYNVTGNGANHSQNFMGNETNRNVNFGDSDHLIEFNSWQSSSGVLPTYLAYQEPPEFLIRGGFSGMGFGFFGNNASNPASTRFGSPDKVFVNCGEHVWDGNVWTQGFPAGVDSRFFDLHIDNGNICAPTQSLAAWSVRLAPGARFFLESPHNLTLSDTVFVTANSIEYAQFLADGIYPVQYQMTLSNPGWHLLGIPVSGWTLAMLEQDIRINYDGHPIGPSLYTWNPQNAIGEAVFEPVLNNSVSLSGKPFNLFVNSTFVKNGRGDHQDGNLPVTITLRGNSYFNNFSQSDLGFGTVLQVQGSTNTDGWNLLINPYPTAIHIDEVFQLTPTSFEQGVYLFNPVTGTFELRSHSGLLPSPNENYIAPGLAFWIRFDSDNHLPTTFFDFQSHVRSVAVAPATNYKTPLGLSLFLVDQTNDSVGSSRIYFSEEATREYSTKDISFFPQSDEAAILPLKMRGGQHTRLKVAGFPEDFNRSIWLDLKGKKPGKHRIGLVDEMSFHHIFLEDRQQKSFYDLLMGDVEVLLDTGWTSGRFRLHFDQIEATTPFKLWLNGQRLNLEIDGYQGSVNITVYDIQGKKIVEVNKHLFNQQDAWDLPFLPTGIYTVRIDTEAETKVDKFPLFNR
jgi:hypothetical protein